MSLAVVEDALVHECGVVIRIHSKHREWQIGGHLVKRFDDQHLVARTHGHAFCPAAGDVGQRQRVDELAVGLRAAAVFDHVDLEEAWRRIAPVGEGTHRDAAPDGRAHTLAAFALPVDLQTRIGQHAIDGRRADLKEFGFDDRIQLEMAVPFHGINQLRDQRLQALAANPVGCFPQHCQRLAYRLVV